MTAYTGKFIHSGSGMLTAVVKTGQISGVVTNSGTPVSRRVALFREDDITIHMETVSDRTTGAFSFSVPFSTDATKYSVLVYGEYGEADKILSNITALSS